MKMFSVGTEVFLADGETDRQAETIVVFRNFTKACEEMSNCVSCLLKHVRKTAKSDC